MQNEAGDNVDLYIPRKCSWTNRLVPAKDHASTQVNVANVDPVTGVATGDSSAYCLAGYLRFKSEGDMALTALVHKKDQEALLTSPASAVSAES
jgi:small subunit ribosomal protein S21e